MVLHGAGWFIPENRIFWSRLDRAYLNVVMPIYCRRAATILSVSDVTTDVFNRRFGLPDGKVQTVYFAPGRQFKRVDDTDRLEAVRAQYGLPERFVLTLSKYPGGDRKNIGGILEAYRAIHGKTGHKLVVVGKDCDRFRVEYNIPVGGYGADVLFPGYVDQSDLPAVYSMADLFLYPSMMEAFPIPITEALACGTPIVTSDRNGLREIAGDAAILVDSTDADAIARAALSVLKDDSVQRDLSSRGLQRSRRYSWDKCAAQTLEALEGVV
jgi:glycosyltransferase involved in cell wall biosynthesis